MEDTTNNFLNSVNNTQKTVGHNKFQQQIEEQQSEIKRWRVVAQEKDETIKTLSQRVDDMQKMIDEKEIVIKDVEIQLQSTSAQTSETTDNLLDELAKAKEENEEHINTIADLNKQLEVVSIQNEGLEMQVSKLDGKLTLQANELVQLKSGFDKMTSENDTLQSEVANLSKQLSSSTNITAAASTELQQLRDELSQMRLTANLQMAEAAAEMERQVAIQQPKTDTTTPTPRVEGYVRRGAMLKQRR
jgi:chromosome segregation ATPase